MEEKLLVNFVQVPVTENPVVHKFQTACELWIFSPADNSCVWVDLWEKINHCLKITLWEWGHVKHERTLILWARQENLYCNISTIHHEKRRPLIVKWRPSCPKMAFQTKTLVFKGRLVLFPSCCWEITLCSLKSWMPFNQIPEVVWEIQFTTYPDIIYFHFDDYKVAWQVLASSQKSNLQDMEF